MARTRDDSQAEMTFFEHLDALRPHLVRGFVAVLVIMVVAFLSKGFIVDTIILGPQSPDFPTNRFFDWVATAAGVDYLRLNRIHFNIINTAMAGQFNMHMKVSFVTAIVLVVPYLLWEIWRFVRPALTPGELRGSRSFVLYVSLCFFAGLLFGYYLITPLTINFLSRYTVSPEIVNMIDFSSYISTVIWASLACAILFQLPLLIYYLSRMGIVSASFLARQRKYAIVVILIFAAIITPPDVFSQILVGLPLYGLYELSIRLARRVERKRPPDDTGGEPEE